MPHAAIIIAGDFNRLQTSNKSIPSETTGYISY
jgi:hypothetical protein